jgi:RimJ/RimL family protein N-acetyltransferase
MTASTPSGAHRAKGWIVLPDPPLSDPAAGILLRPWSPSPEDAAALAAAWADPDLAAANRLPADASLATAARWLRGDAERRRRGVELDLVVGPLRGEAAVLGEVGLRNFDRARGRAELSWWTAPGHRDRGVASAAARLLAEWARRPPLGLVQVWCRIDPANERSAGVAAAAGLVRLGTASGLDVWASATPPAPTSAT